MSKTEAGSDASKIRPDNALSWPQYLILKDTMKCICEADIPVEALEHGTHNLVLESYRDPISSEEPGVRQAESRNCCREATSENKSNNGLVFAA